MYHALALDLFEYVGAKGYVLAVVEKLSAATCASMHEKASRAVVVATYAQSILDADTARLSGVASLPGHSARYLVRQQEGEN